MRLLRVKGKIISEFYWEVCPESTTFTSEFPIGKSDPFSAKEGCDL